MEKITLADYYRLAKKEINTICDVSKGDLIMINSRKDKRKIVGIVVKLYKDRMCILFNNKREWWSRYVNCDILSYNKE
mgnify:CR=1 FL=1|tara:strand:+ start:214 stop:447 length:234 start_codon:yes stop_codon:yes gene_type:complete